MEEKELWKELKIEESPKCKICGKEIRTNHDREFILIRNKGKKDEYMHIDCYTEPVEKEIRKEIRKQLIDKLTKYQNNEKGE